MKLLLKRLEGLSSRQTILIKVKERYNSDVFEHVSKEMEIGEKKCDVNFEVCFNFPFIDSITINIIEKSKIRWPTSSGCIVLKKSELVLNKEITKEVEWKLSGFKDTKVILELFDFNENVVDRGFFEGSFDIGKYLTLKCISEGKSRMALIAVSNNNKFAKILRKDFNNLKFCTINDVMFIINISRAGSFWSTFLVFIESDDLSVNVALNIDLSRTISKSFRKEGKKSIIPIPFIVNRLQVIIQTVNISCNWPISDLSHNLNDIDSKPVPSTMM